MAVRAGCNAGSDDWTAAVGEEERTERGLLDVLVDEGCGGPSISNEIKYCGKTLTMVGGVLGLFLLNLEEYVVGALGLPAGGKTPRSTSSSSLSLIEPPNALTKSLMTPGAFWVGRGARRASSIGGRVCGPGGGPGDGDREGEPTWPTRFRPGGDGFRPRRDEVGCWDLCLDRGRGLPEGRRIRRGDWESSSGF